MTFAKVKQETKEEVKAPQGTEDLEPNNGYNIDEEYDELFQEELERISKYQEDI